MNGSRRAIAVLALATASCGLALPAHAALRPQSTAPDMNDAVGTLR